MATKTITKNNKINENPLMLLFRIANQKKQRNPTSKEAMAFIKLHKNYPIVYKVAIFESKRHRIPHTYKFYTEEKDTRWYRNNDNDNEVIKIFVESSPNDYWSGWGNSNMDYNWDEDWVI